MRRGCVADLTEVEENDCLRNSDHCKICESKNCNTREKFQECHSCNGQNDEHCSRDGRLAKTEICKAYGSTCAIGIDEKGYTHRRCNNQIIDAVHEFPVKNFICEEDKCNDRIFPEDRLKCYQCNGGNNCDMMPSDSDGISLIAEPCEIYSEHDQCFTYINEGKCAMKIITSWKSFA